MSIDCAAIAVGFALCASLFAVAMWLGNHNRIEEEVEFLISGWFAFLMATLIWAVAMQKGEQGLGEIRQFAIVVGASTFHLTRTFVRTKRLLPTYFINEE